MSYIQEHDDGHSVICLRESVRILVPKDWPIINDESMPLAEGVWFVELRGYDEARDANLPRHSVWLEPCQYSESVELDERIVLESYLRRFNATDEQRGRFARWDEICAAWEKNHSLKLVAEVRQGDYLCLGAWPVVPGSVAEDYYLVFSDDGDALVP